MYTCRARVREKSAIPKAFSTDVPTSSAISYCMHPYIHTNTRMDLHRTYTPPISTCKHISSHLHTLTHTYTYTHFRITPHSTLKSSVECRVSARKPRAPHSNGTHVESTTLDTRPSTLDLSRHSTLDWTRHTTFDLSVECGVMQKSTLDLTPHSNGTQVESTTLHTQVECRKHLRSPVLKLGFRHPRKTGRKSRHRRRAKQGVMSHSYPT